MFLFLYVQVPGSHRFVFPCAFQGSKINITAFTDHMVSNAKMIRKGRERGSLPSFCLSCTFTHDVRN